ncbi:MAG: SRPBCC domain-containing protein [Candidatus Paceibacterales bacterium]
MKNFLQFVFIADKKKNTLTIRREFLAGRQLVWDCYTKRELLDRWFAPKPLTTKTKSMDFREGGHWHYAMVEPNGTEYWGWTEYRKIKPIDYYTTFDAFSNAEGEINKDMPRADWRVNFTDKGKNSLVETIVTYQSLSDLEKVIQMGMEQGMMATLEKLDELLLTIKAEEVLTN